MRDRGQDLPLPSCPAPHLIEYLFEIGPTIPAGMGMSQIEWRDIDAWCERTGVDLPPWQARLLRLLSRDYLVMLREAEDPMCPAPMSHEADVLAKRAAVSRDIGAMFRTMAKG